MNSWLILILAALLCAGVAAFVLAAYRRAGAAEAKPAPALILCGVAAAAALALYLFMGRPDLADQPYDARMAALQNRDPSSFSADEALAVLGKAARENPHDARPHVFTGDILLNMERPQDAARAYDAALRRDAANPDALLGMGKALMQSDEGRVGPEALRLFSAAAEAAPRDPRPWIYQAMAAMQQGQSEAATRAWREAGKRMDADDPRRAMAERFGRGEMGQP